MFHGFDFDNTMLRIGSMNMLLHGVENPDVRYKDSLAEEHSGDEESYTLVLANPPFAGSLDYENTAKDLQAIVKTKKTELLFLALFLRLLKPEGRAAVIVPDGVLFGSSKAHKELRRLLVEEQKLDAVISLPGGVFKPYAGVSTAILLFTKTNSGGTDFVWFYDVDADGWSLDDKRALLLSEDKLGAVPTAELTAEEHTKNNLPDVLSRWQVRNTTERERLRTAQSFCVPKVDIATQGYDLSLNRYKEVVHEEVEHRTPKDILANLAKLEAEIQQGTMNIVNAKNISELLVPVPPIKEQRRIAEVLDRAEEIRSKRREAIAQLDTLIKAIFLEMFGNPVTNPKGFTIRKIKDLLESASYGTSEKSSSEGEFPVLRMNNITRSGEIDLTDLKYMDLADSQKERYLVRSGDVLFNRTNSAELVGKTAIIRNISSPMAFAGYLVRLRVNKENDPEYLSAFLNTDYSKRVLRGMCKSIIGMANINATEVQTIKIAQPPLHLQQEFAHRVEAVEKLKIAHRASLSELDALFASLQHRAFRGEL